ncbi:MAG: hypothetical protein R2849_08615 [Thermomicrobiales bacterium]
MKSLGLGIAIAILLDTTVVRAARPGDDAPARRLELVAPRLHGESPSAEGTGALRRFWLLIIVIILDLRLRNVRRFRQRRSNADRHPPGGQPSDPDGGDRAGRVSGR